MENNAQQDKEESKEVEISEKSHCDLVVEKLEKLNATMKKYNIE